MATNNAINLSAAGITAYDGAGLFFGRTITGNTGITVTNGSGVAGNPTLSLAVTVPTSFPVSAGTSPVILTGNALSILGTLPIVTTGSANTITISANNATTTTTGVASFVSTFFTVSAGAVSLVGSIPQSFPVSAGTSPVVPTANSLSILGTAPIVTTGTANTITISANNATTTTTGVASFVSTFFTVTGGAVSLVGSVPLTFNGNTGSATPASNALSILGSGGITTTGSGFTLTIASTGGGLFWTPITASAIAAANTGYFVTSGAVVLTLPSSPTTGTVVAVTLDGGTSWQIKAPASTTVAIGSQATTTAGTLTSTAVFGDSAYLVAQSTTRWNVINSMGNITVA